MIIVEKNKTVLFLSRFGKYKNRKEFKKQKYEFEAFKKFWNTHGAIFMGNLKLCAMVIDQEPLRKYCNHKKFKPQTLGIPNKDIVSIINIVSEFDIFDEGFKWFKQELKQDFKNDGITFFDNADNALIIINPNIYERFMSRLKFYTNSL